MGLQLTAREIHIVQKAFNQLQPFHVGVQPIQAQGSFWFNNLTGPNHLIPQKPVWTPSPGEVFSYQPNRGKEERYFVVLLPLHDALVFAQQPSRAHTPVHTTPRTIPIVREGYSSSLIGDPHLDTIIRLLDELHDSYVPPPGFSLVVDPVEAKDGPTLFSPVHASVPAPRCTHDISYEDAEGQERCHDCGEPVHETV